MKKFMLMVLMLLLPSVQPVLAVEWSPMSEEPATTAIASEPNTEIAAMDATQGAVDCFYEANQNHPACAKDKSEDQYAVRDF